MSHVPLTTYNFRSNGKNRLATLDQTLGSWQIALVRSDLTEAEVTFLTGAYFNTQQEIADTHAEMANCEAKQVASLPVLTAAARANPARTCYKCDGQGKIRGFGHIENGTCFACNGTGVRRVRVGA